MRPPLKLSSIDQEHLQELYNDTGVGRDDLPYSESFDRFCQGFQDRTFKNAHQEQIYAAIIKYVRSSGHAAREQAGAGLDPDQTKQLKSVLSRHGKGGKVLPYSDEFESAMKEFNKVAGVALTEVEFWRAIMKSQGPKRSPPKRAKVAAPPVEIDDDVE